MLAMQYVVCTFPANMDLQEINSPRSLTFTSLSPSNTTAVVRTVWLAITKTIAKNRHCKLKRTILTPECTESWSNWRATFGQFRFSTLRDTRHTDMSYRHTFGMS